MSSNEADSRSMVSFSFKHDNESTAINEVGDLKRQIVELKTQIYDYKSMAQRYKDLQVKCRTLEQLQQTAKCELDDLKCQLKNRIAQHEEECEKRKTSDNVLSKTKSQLDHMMQELTREHTSRQKSELNYKNVYEELLRAQERQKSFDVEYKDLQKQLEEEHRNCGSLQIQLLLERQKLRSSLRESQDEKMLESSCQLEEIYKRLRCDSAENLCKELETYQKELHRTRSCLKEERKIWIEKNEELQARIDQLEHEKKLCEEALEMASLSYNSEIITLYNELKFVQLELDKNQKEKESDSAHSEGKSEPQDEPQQQLDQFDKYNQVWNDRFNIREQELQQLRETNRSLTQKVTLAEQRICSVELKIKEYEKRGSEQKERIKSLRADLMQGIREFENLQSAKSQTDEHNVRLQKQIQYLSRKFAELRKNDMCFQQKINEFTKKLETRENCHEFVQDLRRALSNYQKCNNTTLGETIERKTPPLCVASHSANKINDLINHIDRAQDAQFDLQRKSCVKQVLL